MNATRKETSRYNFRLFCEQYLASSFTVAWTSRQLEAIRQIEQAVLFGGMGHVDLERGNGKSTLCVAAALWATMYGHHGRVSIVGTNMHESRMMLDAIEDELQHNQHLKVSLMAACSRPAHGMLYVKSVWRPTSILAVPIGGDVLLERNDIITSSLVIMDSPQFDDPEHSKSKREKRDAEILAAVSRIGQNDASGILAATVAG